MRTYGPFAPCARLRGNWPKGEAQTAPVSGGTLARVGLHAIAFDDDVGERFPRHQTLRERTGGQSLVCHRDLACC